MNLTGIPECGVNCLVSALSQSSCLPSDDSCLCADHVYNDFVNSCVLGNCSVKEQLTTQRVTSLGCGVTYNDTTGSLKLLHYLLFASQTIFFILRMASRALKLAPWDLDDTTIVVLTLGFLGSGIAEAELGAGKPYWTFEFWEITATLKVYFIFEILYTVTLGMIKISICFLYIRIFSNSTLKKVLWGTQTFNILLIVVFLCADFGQCVPLSYFWDAWDKEHSGSCFDINAMAYTHSAINIALDVWMLILPAIQVWRLNMSFKKKLGVSAMFAIGIFLTAASIVRLTTLREFAKDPNDYTSYYPVAVWTVVELTVGMIVASLPAARIIVVKYGTSVLDATIRSSRRTESKTLPSYKKKSISNSNSSSLSRFGGRLKLPMLSFGGGGLMNSNWRELPASETSRYDPSPGSMPPIELNSGNNISQNKRVNEGETGGKEVIM
ncbi:hypothetical protein LA080_013761 [Diaporthe eres]|nr:hypothetical protein LA080_013761 [Diaporthe eres]